MLERATRVTSPSRMRLKVTEGRISERANSIGVLPCPTVGSQSRCSPKISISIMPNQNAGMDTPNKAKVIAAVSIQVPRFKADRMPMGKAKHKHKANGRHRKNNGIGQPLHDFIANIGARPDGLCPCRL